MKYVLATSAVWLALFAAVLAGGRLPAFGVTAAPAADQHEATPTPTPGTPLMTHDQMHQMMDAMHGAGTSERMHEAMGAEAEQMMDQCVAMMNMMQNMSSMMGGNMGGMMQGMGGTQGMMGSGMMSGGMMGSGTMNMGSVHPRR